MLRFIIQNQRQDNHIGLGLTDYYTLDIDVPELEAALTRGGHGEMGFDLHSLMGVEILAGRQPDSVEVV
jgi:hypothetical protein